MKKTVDNAERGHSCPQVRSATGPSVAALSNFLRAAVGDRPWSERLADRNVRAPLARYLKYAAPIAVLASLSIFGADAPALKPLTPPSTSFGVAFFRMIGSLAFVVAIFFGGAWLFRNMHRFRQTAGPARKLQVLEAKSLGARQAIYVVGFEEQRLLIGSTPQGLTLLTHLPDGVTQPETERIVPVSFGEALLQALGRK
jgi:flagellar biosynthetic protein FliO